MPWGLIKKLIGIKGITIEELPIELIDSSGYQPRKRIHDATLEELSHSIKSYGLLQPIIVKRAGAARFVLIAGHRRLEAAKLAGLQRIPAIIQPEATGDEQVLELSLVENLQREDLNPLEEALGFQRLMQDFGLTQEQVAHRVGKSRAYVANALRLLNLPKTIQDELLRQDITPGHARALLSLELEPAKQAKVLKIIKSKNLSVRETEELIRSLKKPEPMKEVKPRLQDKVALKQAQLELFKRKLRAAVETLRKKGIEVVAVELEDEQCLTFTIKLSRASLDEAFSQHLS